MSTVRKSAELDQVAARLRLSESNRGPLLGDLQAMFAKSKEMPGRVIEWAWTEETNSRSYTLTAKFPYFNDEDWWEYELKGDPEWCLRDNRSQGDHLVLEHKTSDLNLVIDIVNTMLANARKAAERSRRAHVGVEAELGPRSSFSTPVFPELRLADELDPDPTRNLQQVFPALAYSRFTGKVEICNDDKIGQVFFEDGLLIHATFSAATGDAAAREIISWRIGNVTCSQDEQTETRSVTKPIDLLLREGHGLLDQKRFLTQQGLAYESYLIKSGKYGSAGLPAEFVLAKKILDYLDRRRTLTDVIRELKPQASEWVPAVCDLLNRRLIGIRPPRKERSATINFLSDVDDQATHLYSAETGLYKYEAFLSFLQREFQLFQQRGVLVSLIVFEMSSKAERLDQKNEWLSAETVGLIGEKIELLKRPLDTFAHFETLDFALLMPNTDLSQATFMAERIVHTLTKLPFKTKQAEKNLLVFCGVANLPAQGSSIKSLITAALQAKDQAREWQWPIVTSPVDQALLENPPQEVHPPVRSARLDPGGDRYGPIGLQDLLISAWLISHENFETAFLLSEKMHMPIGKVLSIEGHIQQRTVDAASHVLSMINEQQLSVDSAIKALQLVDNHGLDIDIVLKRLGTVTQGLKRDKLGQLLKRAGIIKRWKLEEELRHSISVGLPLGWVLVNRGILSQYTLQAALMILGFIRDKSLSHEDGIKALKAVHSGSSSLRQYLRENHIDVTEPVAGLGELLVLGGLLSESELISAREIELMDRKDLESILLKQGYVTEPVLNTAKQLLISINDGKMNREQAAQFLRNNKHIPLTASVIERDFLLESNAELEKFSAVVKPAPVSNAELEKFSAVVKPAPESNAELESVGTSKSVAQPEVSETIVKNQSSSPTTASETSTETQPLESLSLAVTGEIPQVGASQTETQQTLVENESSSQPTAPETSTETPPLESLSSAVTDEIPQVGASQTETGQTLVVNQSLSPPTASETNTETQPLESLSLAVTGEIPQVGASQTETPQTAPRSADESQSSQSPPGVQARTPESKPIKPPRPKTTTIEIDRVKLLRTANFIDDKQIKQALAISNAHNTSLFRTLFDTGEIDQPAVNLAGAAKRHIESGRIDIPQAVKIMRHCKEHKIGFDEALDALEHPL
jgi:GGDEF domain-containing protein